MFTVMAKDSRGQKRAISKPEAKALFAAEAASSIVLIDDQDKVDDHMIATFEKIAVKGGLRNKEWFGVATKFSEQGRWGFKLV